MEENATFSIFYVACVLEKNMTDEAANSDVPAFLVCRNKICILCYMKIPKTTAIRIAKSNNVFSD